MTEFIKYLTESERAIFGKLKEKTAQVYSSGTILNLPPNIRNHFCHFLERVPLDVIISVRRRTMIWNAGMTYFKKKKKTIPQDD